MDSIKILLIFLAAPFAFISTAPAQSRTKSTLVSRSGWKKQKSQHSPKAIIIVKKTRYLCQVARLVETIGLEPMTLCL